MDIKFDILDYLGKYDDGVIVILSMLYDGEWYEASFYYKEDLVSLTPDEKLEEKLGCQIEDWEDYTKLMLDIIKKLVPYEQIINQVDNLNPADYNLYLDKGDS
jgi:hypothetical protein